MRLTRSDVRNRRVIALLCSGIVLVHILIVHPLPDTHHADDASSGHGVVAVASFTAHSVSGVVQNPNHVVIACADAEWVLSRIENVVSEALVEPGLSSVLVVLLSGLVSQYRTCILPIPDGPDRQARLQVFRL